MRQFNIEEAKAGVPVCTRGGRDVTILDFHKKDLESTSFKTPIIAKVRYTLLDDESSWEESVYTYAENGQIDCTGEESILDLMMADQKVTIWVNVYNYLGLYTRVFNSEEAAREDAENHLGYETLLATKEITIEI